MVLSSAATLSKASQRSNHDEPDDWDIRALAVRKRNLICRNFLAMSLRVSVENRPRFEVLQDRFMIEYHDYKDLRKRAYDQRMWPYRVSFSLSFASLRPCFMPGPIPFAVKRMATDNFS